MKRQPIYAEVNNKDNMKGGEEDNKEEDDEEKNVKITYGPFLVLGLCVICTFLFLVIFYYSYNYGISYIKTEMRKRNIHLKKTKYVKDESIYKQDICSICLEAFENDSSLSVF